MFIKLSMDTWSKVRVMKGAVDLSKKTSSGFDNEDVNNGKDQHGHGSAARTRLFSSSPRNSISDSFAS